MEPKNAPTLCSMTFFLIASLFKETLLQIIKKIVTVLGLVLFISSQIEAARLDKGFKFGIIQANLAGDTPDAVNLGAKTGFVVGPFFTAHFGSRLAAQAEMLYMRKGGQSVQDTVGISTSDGSGLSTKWLFDYLELPVLVKYQLGSNGIARPAVYFGPTLSILLNSQRSFLYFGDDVKQKFDVAKSTDFGWTVGGDVNFDVSKGQLCFDFRYTMGLSSVLKSPLDGQNKAITLMLGYSF